MKEKIVLVEWWDACGGSKSGWHPMKDIVDQKPALARSVGFLVRNEPDVVVVCPHTVEADGHMDGDGELAIPKSWVKRIKVLK